MKDYLEKRRAELKKRGNKGFTLMEMLIVVAIIAVLIAIAIPVFTSQLENARDATSVANMRSAYAEAQAAYLTGNSGGNATVAADKSTVTVANVKIESAQANQWSQQAKELPFTAPEDPGTAGTRSMEFKYDANGGITEVKFV